MFDKDIIFEHLVERIGILLNSDNPREEMQKLITLEYTLNPMAPNMGYDEVLEVVVSKLINFYADEILEELWTQYLLFEGVEAIEDLDKVS